MLAWKTRNSLPAQGLLFTADSSKLVAACDTKHGYYITLVKRRTEAEGQNVDSQNTICWNLSHRLTLVCADGRIALEDIGTAGDGTVSKLASARRAYLKRQEISRVEASHSAHLHCLQ